ncbi:sirohydrochlorin chelatase [Herbaspirillum sp. alder98]|uniref:sirohydrochlorin chelatase n=1 Tax=Herbaspirillum sp. alder98 TaxID=2913096 RepID=UPI001CD90053|nr:CbiX/SirB N-terminal domain-containing protein [Herbaspirillum sp. alder98]MCA1322956.1 CbiX/SirB N-terminal domain-containing protein [Herbaspirillum sp. alder98]
MATLSMRSLVLFAHGARDPAWAQPFERLRALVQAARPELSVQLAFLELMQPDLPSLAAAEIGRGVSAITVVPVFLGQGGHVRRDLPQLIGSLRQSHPGVVIDVVDAVGEDDAVLQAIAAYCLRVAHG